MATVLQQRPDERTPPACGLPDAVALAKWRRHRAHAEHGWCGHCQQRGPCDGWVSSRRELVGLGLVFPIVVLPGAHRG